MRYATACNNEGDFVFTVKSLSVSLESCFFFTNYQQRHYWSKENLSRSAFGEKTISSNNFQIIKGVHFCENETESNKSDMGSKVRNHITLF